MKALAAYKLLLGLALAVFAADQATKSWVSATLPYGTFLSPEAIVVIEGFFRIVHVGNTGAAWSLFSGHNYILAIISCLALAIIWLFRRALELKLFSSQLAFGFIIGGILGNALDRLRLGHVVDFLDFKFGSYHWPSFNIADSALTIGVAVYILSNFFAKKPDRSV